MFYSTQAGGKQFLCKPNRQKINTVKGSGERETEREREELDHFQLLVKVFSQQRSFLHNSCSRRNCPDPWSQPLALQVVLQIHLKPCAQRTGCLNTSLCNTLWNKNKTTEAKRCCKICFSLLEWENIMNWEIELWGSLKTEKFDCYKLLRTAAYFT